MFPPDIHDIARQVVESYTSRKLKIVTAESCTGGLVAASLTEIPGSSAVVERGFISYSNESKLEVLGVMPELLSQHGAVSEEVAEAMAVGALEFSRADVAVSLTGIAGPGGGTPLKPVGLIYLGLATKSGSVLHYKCQFGGDRADIREQAVREALRLLLAQTDDTTVEL